MYDFKLFCLSSLNQPALSLFVMTPLRRPLLHAIVGMQIAGATGVELDRIKCDKAEAFLPQALKQLEKRGLIDAGVLTAPPITCAPVEDVPSLDPATHAYSFWEGVPFEARAAFGRLFSASKTLCAVAVVQRSMREADPATAMEEWYGFGPLRLVDSFPVSMSGSGRNFMAYVFHRNDGVPRLRLQDAVLAELGTLDKAVVPTPSVSPVQTRQPSDAAEEQEESSVQAVAYMPAVHNTRRGSKRQAAEVVIPEKKRLKQQQQPQPDVGLTAKYGLRRASNSLLMVSEQNVAAKQSNSALPLLLSPRGLTSS